ncbi:DUF6431 domain-containing protein [Hornefia butyriciproducens]|uniref:DUF6431 domain-containing protein n=1 Tax=Hornefia butyriciproducens TaxID=2652293 RepID=UPI003D04E4BF
MVTSNEDPICPVCGGRLRKKDRVNRINKKIGDRTDRLRIERRMRTNKSCRKTHRLLPDICIPYKHYNSGVIEDMIDVTLNEEALCEEAYPSESALYRWREWAKKFRENAAGQIRSAAYRILDLQE